MVTPIPGGRSGAVGWGAELLVPWARVRPGAAVIAVPKTAIELAKRFEVFTGWRGLIHVGLSRTSARSGTGRLATGTCATRSTRRSLKWKPQSIWRAICKRRLRRLCATARCWPPSQRGGWRPSWTSRSTSARGDCRRRTYGAGSSAAKELRRWVYGGGKVLPGLIARRAADVGAPAALTIQVLNLRPGLVWLPALRAYAPLRFHLRTTCRDGQVGSVATGSQPIV